MREAVIGLLGAAVGGLISGGATYLMSRRQESLQARASTRLLQDELGAVERGLAALLRLFDEPAGEWPRPWLAVGERAVLMWHEHQGRLAGGLDSSDGSR